MSIEGIPDGWDAVRFDHANKGESLLNGCGEIILHIYDTPSPSKHLIVSKKPKRYRPFANAAEFEPHRDRWIRRSSKHDTPDTIPAGCFRVTAYNDHHYWTVDGSYTSYEQAFNDNKCFDDGTPFGIEVTE